MIWFKYQLHEYMDEKPELGFRLFDSNEQARAWEKHMQESYSGGTTHLIGYASQKEILEFVDRYGVELSEETRNNIDNTDNYAV